MEYRVLGRTGLRVSAIAFGAGPVSGLMTGDDLERQTATIRRALELGVNWIDTAPGYGQGRSETALGRRLLELGASDSVHIATKVRLLEDDFTDVVGAVRRSVEASLARLGRTSVTLLQLHNGITARRGDEPDSIAPADILDSGKVLDAFRTVQRAGLVQFVGLTGAGQPDAMRQVIRCGEFDTVQTPYNLLNPSAGLALPPSFPETNYGNIIADAAQRSMGVFAIRVFAGGALLDRPPSAHTMTTKYFPLALYERDLARAAELGHRLTEVTRSDHCLRFALAHPQIHAAIIGFGSPEEVSDAASAFSPRRKRG